MAAMPLQRKKAAPAREPDPPMMIGDGIEGTLVSCPACGRPVADGLVRCGGCGTRLLMGVAASRALLFLTTGLVLGLLVGGLSVATVLDATRRPVPPPAAAIAPAASPNLRSSTAPATPGLTPTSMPSPTLVAPAVDPLAASALRQIASTNSQLAGWLTVLQGQVRRYRPVDTGAVSTTLRAISAAATSGSTVVPDLGGWPDAGPFQAEIGRLYSQVQAVAAGGLAAALSNQAAYWTAASQMTVLLRDLPSLRAESAALAQQGGIDLPAPTSPPQPILVPSPSA